MAADRWPTIERLYHEAPARPAKDRTAFLSQACGGDGVLRHEVESLLAHDGDASFLSTPAASSGDRPALLIGQKLGPYVISARLGEGGMGEVYRARDTTLGRDVAIKVLPAIFASHPDRLARFTREARMLAALNHPHIAAIYGFEESAGIHALVLELVEGPTLSDRLAKGPLSITEALAIAKQVAEALEAAHDHGIIHRDLKPANIKITPAGVVKVLDFGLAKLAASRAGEAGVAGAPGEMDGASSPYAPTLTIGGTEEGVILGTAAYMSPEQARGQVVDKRTDIWAFGCVLYEMLTSRAAFSGATISDTIAAVLEHAPIWDALPSTLPLGVQRVLHRCLEKDPTRRLRDAGDVRIEIDDALAADASESLSTRPTMSRPVVQWLAFISLLIAVVSGSWVWIIRSRDADSARERQTARFTIQFPPDAPMLGSVGIGSQIALSANGTLAYTARAVQGSNYLYLRKFDELESRRIPGTEGAVDPFFFSDGQWVGFFAGRRLVKVASSGGPPQTIHELDTGGFGFGASWSSDGSVVFAKAGSGLWRLPFAEGTPMPLTRLKDKETNHAWPEVLPGGKGVLFTAITDSGNPQIYAQSLETGERRAVAQGSGAHYLTSGHIVYGVGDSLVAMPFNAERLEVAGAPVRVVDNVFTKGGAVGALQVAVSQGGALAFVPRTPVPRTLVWVARTGEERSLNLPPRSYFQPRLAPDEQRLAVMITGENSSSDAWLWDLSHHTLSRLTDDGGHNYLLWTPDGRRVSFLSNSGPVASGGRGTITWKRVDDSNAVAETLLSGPTAGPPLSWSPNGVLAFVNIDPVNRQDIWTLTVDGKAQPRPFLRTRFAEGSPAFSPDGRWLAYVSDESGHNEIYVQSFPGPGQKFTISTDGGSELTWSRRGHELFYLNGSSMMAVDVTTGNTFTVGRPRHLFDGIYARSTSLWPNYDVTADGKRFLMVKTVEDFTSRTQITVVLNWVDELRQRVPVK